MDVVEGMQFDRGYLSPYFVTNTEKMTTELENPLVLLVEKKLTNLQPMVPLLESVVQANRPLMIISEDVEGEASPSTSSEIIINGLLACTTDSNNGTIGCKFVNFFSTKSTKGFSSSVVIFSVFVTK